MAVKLIITHSVQAFFVTGKGRIGDIAICNEMWKVEVYTHRNSDPLMLNVFVWVCAIYEGIIRVINKLLWMR